MPCVSCVFVVKYCFGGDSVYEENGLEPPERCFLNGPCERPSACWSVIFIYGAATRITLPSLQGLLSSSVADDLFFPFNANGWRGDAANHESRPCEPLRGTYMTAGGVRRFVRRNATVRHNA